MRSQANTAVLLADNATLMQFREPGRPGEAAPKVACEGKRIVVLADQPRPDVVT